MSKIHPSHFPIVGIGASAGGLKAIEAILKALPADTGMAFVVVQHLSRRYKSLMQEILAKDTEMTIEMAENDVVLKPNHVYLIPAGKNLRIQGGGFVLEDQMPSQTPQFVIDVFFHSLGEYAGENGIAVILSGTGSDGSRGIRTIKERGGIVIVQDPHSGEFDGMPLSAIDTRIVDFVLPPTEIAGRLEEISRLDELSSIDSRSQPGIRGRGEIDGPEADLEQILHLLHKYHEVDFSYYKAKTLRRRIEKHMALHKSRDLASHYQLLLNQPVLAKDLFYELLIGVTDFFRDEEAYETLHKVVFPRLFKEGEVQAEVRIWICGCSTGEEAYSLAISIEEYADLNGFRPNYTILATDINEVSLATAGRGRYEEDKLEGMDAYLKDKYFKQDRGFFEIKSFVRDHIIFARNDATLDPPFINLNLVACRNMLIYFKPETQRRLLLNFHFGLNPGGLLWLGSSENILDFKPNYKVLVEKWRIFQTQGETPRKRDSYSFSRVGRNTAPRNFGGGLTSRKAPPTRFKSPRLSHAKVLMDRYVPTSILADENLNILYLSGGAGKYLSLPDLDMTPNLMGMVSQEVILVLRDALNRLEHADKSVLYPDIAMVAGRADERVSLKVEKVSEGASSQIYIIEIQPEAAHTVEQGTDPVDSEVISLPKLEANTLEIINELQSELRQAKQDVQHSREELETSNEELQASNEELLAANEELQSTNEELQSVNEELYTVNSELQALNRSLTDANTTIDNLLSTIEIRTLFLDNDLNIKFLTSQVSDILPINLLDVGSSIDRFRFTWKYPSFLDDLQTVLHTNRAIERRIQGQDPAVYFEVQIHPLLKNGKQEGLVVTIIDISEQELAQKRLKYIEFRQRKMLDHVPEIVSVLDETGLFLYINRPAEGWQESDILGQNFFGFLAEENRSTAERSFREAMLKGDIHHFMAPFTQSHAAELYQHTIVPIEDDDTVPLEVMIVSKPVLAE